jgi:glycosyltransferase involved in cell wall biosynthesis
MTAAARSGTPRVLIAYKSLPRYRVPFFERLHDRLDELGIDLRLVVGQPARREAARGDQGELEWALRTRNRIVSAAGREVIVQPVVSQARGADLVIVEQANRLVVNYVLLALQPFGLTRVCFWGHGANLQARRPRSAAERVKRAVSRRPHWWFAYTNGSRDRVAALGFPAERITVVQNAQDTESLAAAVRSRRETALGDGPGPRGGPVGLFLGSLERERRVDFLVRAAGLAARRVPGFRLVIAGDGEDRGAAVRAARRHDWIQYVGRVDGVEARAELLAAADVLLAPGPVGLVVVDSFAAEVPLVATASAHHGPEIEYLQPGVNGLVVAQADDADAYGAAIASVLLDPEEARRLRRGCAEAAARYTLAAMIDRFATGVLQALEAR